MLYTNVTYYYVIVLHFRVLKIDIFLLDTLPCLWKCLTLRKNTFWLHRNHLLLWRFVYELCDVD